MRLRLGYVALALAGLPAGACDRDRGLDPGYYYPTDELLGGLVYVYAPADGAAAPPQYWYLRAVQTPDSLVLVTTGYDPDLQPSQLQTERIVATGSLLRDVRLFVATDTTSAVAVATVLQPAQFSFEPPDPDRVLVSAIRIAPDAALAPRDDPGASQPTPRDASTAATYTLTRNRRYRHDTTFVYRGEELPAQAWTVHELIEQDSAGVLAVESIALEVYARGLGLVYRERRFASGEGEAHRLVDRIPMDTRSARGARP